ncbi:hypothetical protein FDECE_6667 [Fusarium decemcellulare]|nr:hypothetical protein FDECE_6667 [Fusarium decemcellulare]
MDTGYESGENPRYPADPWGDGNDATSSIYPDPENLPVYEYNPFPFDTGPSHTPGSLTDDWAMENAADVEEDAEDAAVWTFDVPKLINKMVHVDLDDDSKVEFIISHALTPEERVSLALSQEAERDMMMNLSTREDSVALMSGNGDIMRGVSVFRKRIGTIVDRLVQFFLCVGQRDNCPHLMRGWFLFCLANASKDARYRLVRLLSHPSVIDPSTQYILGLSEWSVDLLDAMTHIDLDKFTNRKKRNDRKTNSIRQQFVTAYAGVAHCPSGDNVLYSGSATSLTTNKPLMGEERRMSEHARMLAGGLEEVLSRRRDGTGWCLYIHEKMARAGSKNSFFTPMFRFPVEPGSPLAKKAAALALFAETCTMILLSTVSENAKTRKSQHQAIAKLSRELLHGLRPKDFPAPCWRGANLVLPLLQNPGAIWKLLRDQVNEVARTDELMLSLEDCFRDTRRPWISRTTCAVILKEHRLSSCHSSFKALQAFYGDVLNQHGLEYQNLHQRYLLRLSILWVAIIREAEDKGLVSLSSDGKLYSFPITELDWSKVSKRAQHEAPKVLRGNYTVEGYERLYLDYHSAYFNQKVFNQCNWDELRCGLPDSFSAFRPSTRYPPVIKARISEICRYYLYNYLTEQGYLVPLGDATTQLHAGTPSTLTFLRPAILERLKKDVELCSFIDVKDGTWSDEALKAHIMKQLHIRLNELRAGVPWAQAVKWSELEALSSGWANPLQYDIDQPGPARRDTEPLARMDDVARANFELLMAHYIDPAARSPNAEDTVPTPDSDVEDSDVDDDNKESADNADSGFQLRRGDGESARVSLFTILSKSQTASASRPPAPIAPDGKKESRWIDDACPSCGLVVPSGRRGTVHLRSNHENSCIGRCYRCLEKNLVCVGNSETEACHECASAEEDCIIATSVGNLRAQYQRM